MLFTNSASLPIFCSPEFDEEGGSGLTIPVDGDRSPALKAAAPTPESETDDDGAPGSESVPVNGEGSQEGDEDASPSQINVDNAPAKPAPKASKPAEVTSNSIDEDELALIKTLLDPKEVSQVIAQYPEQAAQFLRDEYAKRAKELAAGQTPAAPAPTPSAQPKENASPATPLVDEATLEEAKSVLGEPLYDKLITPLIKRVEELSVKPAPAQQPAGIPREVALLQVNAMIDTLSNDQFGRNGFDLTPAQNKAREDLLVTAATVHQNALKAGRQMTEYQAIKTAATILTNNTRSGNLLDLAKIKLGQRSKTARLGSVIAASASGSRPPARSFESATQALDAKLRQINTGG